MARWVENFLVCSSIAMWMVVLGGCAASVGGMVKTTTTVFPIANCYGFVLYGLFFKVIGNICGR